MLSSSRIQFSSFIVERRDLMGSGPLKANPLKGVLKNAALPAPELRQAGQLRSRHLVVLKYSSVRSVRSSGCGLSFNSGQGWTSLPSAKDRFCTLPHFFPLGFPAFIC